MPPPIRLVSKGWGRIDSVGCELYIFACAGLRQAHGTLLGIPLTVLSRQPRECRHI
jgi:hypothetical protein